MPAVFVPIYWDIMTPMSFGIAGLLLQYKYFVMVPLVFVLQPAVGVVGGALARTGFMDVYVVYAIVAITAIVGDILWYWVGYWWGEPFIKKYGKWFGLSKKHVHLARDLFDKYHAPILFVSKILNGLGLAIVVLVTAGMSRVPFGRYLFLNVIGELIWSAIIVSAGYIASDIFVSLEDVVGQASFIVLMVFVAVLLVRLTRSLYVYLETSVTKESEQR